MGGGTVRQDARLRPPGRLAGLVVAAGVVLLVVACGGGEQAGELSVDELDAEVEAPAEPVEEPESVEEEPAEEPVEEGGVREHRPPQDAETFADCGSIDDRDPGAVIVFPSDDVAGSFDAGPGPVTVEVVGCGNTFEANVQWEAYHGQNRTPTLEGHTMGGTMGDWGAFSVAETYWTPGEWTVVVFEIDAESGERVEYDRVTFAVD